MTDPSKSDSKSARKPLTAERLRELVTYEPDTGIVRWMGPPRKGTKKRRGDPIGGIFDGQGHLGCVIDYQRYYLHRLIWLYVTGEWRTGDIDHINGDPADNRWCNLRAATRSQNTRNRKPGIRNKSGIKGVSYDTSRKKWIATIKAGPIRRHLGRFATKVEAATAYRLAALELHGEFARLD